MLTVACGVRSSYHSCASQLLSTLGHPHRSGLSEFHVVLSVCKGNSTFVRRYRRIWSKHVASAPSSPCISQLETFLLGLSTGFWGRYSLRREIVGWCVGRSFSLKRSHLLLSGRLAAVWPCLFTSLFYIVN